MHTISVIIPFHQYKHYLKECLKSIQQSNEKPYEIIVIKDNVEENIDDLIKKYENVFSLCVYDLENGHGVAAARNKGMQMATGDYVYFLDCDDYVLENTFALLQESIQDNVDVVYGSMHSTWNNKANYIDKRKKYEEEQADIIEEKQLRAQEKKDNYLECLTYRTNESKDEGIYYLLKRRKGFSKMSALGVAYRKAFLESYDIKFDTNFTYYSDIVFLSECISKASSFASSLDSIYVKRKHNDPINSPSLSQREDDNRFNERMDMFKEVKIRAKECAQVRFLMERKQITYFVYNFARRLRRSEEPKWRKEYFNQLSQTLQIVNDDVFKSLKRWPKKMIKALQGKDLKQVQKITRNRLALKKFKKSLKNKNIFYKLAYYHVFLKKPLLNDVVLFESFLGKNYSDNPKYIYEYMAQQYGKQFTYVWVLNNQTNLPFGGKKVRRFSFRYAYYLARAKYLVFNVRQPLWYRKREGQVFVETWHGTPLKRLVFDQEEVTSASPKYKKEFYKQRQDWDYLVSANDFSTTTLQRCFMFENEMLATGYPRNDVLYAKDKVEKAIALRKKLNIPLDKKTILYAPTWRDDEHFGKGKYRFTLQLDLAKMKEQLSDEYIVLLRMHHYIAENIDTSGLEGFAYNVSAYDDISEIYLISDICITDYSSVFFDFANLRRPILFYTYDIEKYKNQLRGFYINMHTEVPGPLLYTSEEVIQSIQDIEQINANYKERYDAFYDRFCHLDDGFASKRIVEKFLQR